MAYYSRTYQTWSLPGTYDTTRPYTKGAMYSPYLAGAERWQAERTNATDKNVTLKIWWGYGFGTGSNSSSWTGSTVTATISGGASGSFTISSGTWKRTGSTATNLVDDMSQTGYPTVKRSKDFSPKYYSINISNWTSGSKTFTMTITAGSQSTSHTITLNCPTYVPTVTISYNANGGTGTMADTTYTYASSGTTNLRLNTFTRTGHTFLGWNTSSSATTAKYTDGQAWNLNNAGPTYTLYAIWQKVTYTLTADANGGSISTTSGWNGTGATSTRDIVYGDAYSVLPIVSRTGYSVNEDSWWTAPSGGRKVTIRTTMGAGNTTIYAQWVANTYTITYDANGGSGTMDPTTYTYAETGTINLEENAFTRTGYTFYGWHYDKAQADAGVRAYTDGQAWELNNASNYTLYAVWKEEKCVIGFHYLSKTGTPTSKVYQVGITSTDKLASTLSVPEYSSYIFSGYWELTENTPVAASDFRTTDKVYDTYVSPYNHTNYSGNYEEGHTYTYKAVYKRPLNSTTKTSNIVGTKVIRYTPKASDPDRKTFSTLLDLISAGGLPALDTANEDSGNTLFVALQFEAGMDYSNLTLHNLTGATYSSVGLSPVRGAELPVSIAPEVPIKRVGSTEPTTVLVGNLIYVVFETNNSGQHGAPLDPSLNYEVYINFGSTLTNDFGVSVTCSDFKLVSQGLNYILDINPAGTMLSMGGVAVDDVEDTNNNGIRKYTPSDNPTVDADNSRSVAPRITALYNAVYVANPTNSPTYQPDPSVEKYNKLIPAITEGIIEDEIVISPGTHNTWTTRLAGGTPAPAPMLIQSLEVTDNGTYTAPRGVAYTPVTVNVSGGGGGVTAQYIDGVLVLS